MERNEDGYYEPTGEFVNEPTTEEWETKMSNTQPQLDDVIPPHEETKNDQWSVDEYIGSHRKQLETEIQETKESQKPTFWEKYSSWWNLRDQLKPVTVLPEAPVQGIEQGIHNLEHAPSTRAEERTGGRGQHQQRKVPEWLSIAPDCAEIFGEPWMVVTMFGLALIVFVWGCIAAVRYMFSTTKDQGLVWWQMSVAFMMITLMGMLLPVRMRFGMNLYGAATVLLLVQYAVFMFCFPLILPSSADLAAIKNYVKSTT